jgi:NAD(P)-dependent dehydrogenase (short-subunit alcohol dehydrogenase family)
VAILTGGARGIGEATARRLAEEGASVMIGDLDFDGAEATAETIRSSGGDALARRCELADPDDIAALVDATADAFGSVDLLDHNAAWTSARRDLDALEVDLEAWDRVLHVNTRGALLLARYCIPRMVDRGGGSMVFISSGSATIGEVTRVAYGVSKAGIEQMVRHLSTRYGRAGIRANAVAPGLVLTETARSALSDAQVAQLEAANPSGRAGTPLDIANAVVFLLSDAASYVNGQTLHVDGGTLVAGQLRPTDLREVR